MSDLPQDYSHIELDKGFIELEGQTLAIKNYPEIYRILNQTLLPLAVNYKKSKQVLNQQKDINPQQ